MKILLCHNHYQEPGGEDLSFELEAALLEQHGHEVIRYTRHNDEIKAGKKLAAAGGAIWNRRSYREIQQLTRLHRPQIAHFTNTFPLISPAAYYAAKREGARVVQSLRNYRLLCPEAKLLRNGRVCESCIGKSVPWRAVVHRCYRGSCAGSATVAAMLAAHRVLGTWKHTVDMYYALTEFARDKFIAGGLPAEKVAVKPNFVHPDPGAGTGEGRYVVFVGRLAPEKGIATLLDAWSRVDLPIRLKIVGDGPLAPLVKAAAAADDRIDWLGRCEPAQVGPIVGDAACLVLSSLWYEGFPRTIVESYSKGTPVVAAKLGSMIELIKHGGSGLHFNPGDPADLAKMMVRILQLGNGLTQMRNAARHEFLSKYTAHRNYESLMDIYRRALGTEQGRALHPATSEHGCQTELSQV